MSKIANIFFTTLILLLIQVSPALAHVVVRPAEVNVAAYQTFTLGVPNEKDSPTVAIRLVLPEGLKSVTPNVKPGWTITVKDNEINWTGGSIPAGQRDEFLFSAQAPASETKLLWKAYQTYQNGVTVSWDHDPAAGHSDDEEGTSGPYSQTKVVNDLVTQNTTPTPPSQANSKLPLVLSLVALALSATAFMMARQKK